MSFETLLSVGECKLYLKNLLHECRKQDAENEPGSEYSIMCLATNQFVIASLIETVKLDCV